MIRKSTFEQGFVLLPVMVIIIIVVSIGLIASQEGTMNLRHTHDLVDQESAQYVAEAGLQHALHHIKHSGCNVYSDILNQPFGNSVYDIQMSTNTIGGTITVYQIPVKNDAYIESNDSGTNFGSSAELVTFYKLLLPNNTIRALYQFDIENSGIPAGSQILSAVAKITVTDPNELAAVTVHQITADWDESSVTWDSIHDDHDSNSITSIPRDAQTGTATDVNITSLAQAWINGSTSNQGIMLKTSFIGDRAEYASKEHSNSSYLPYLEVRVLTGNVSDEIAVTSTGTLANGLSRTIRRSHIPIYQTNNSVVEIQTATKIKDSYIEGENGHHDHNKGTKKEIKVNSAAKPYRGLLQFNLSSVPYGAKISSAELQLNLDTSGGNPESILIHRINNSWDEDTVTWLSRNGTDDWDNPGGDYSNVIFGNLNTNTTGTITADITQLVQLWVDGTAENNGMILVMPTTGNNEKKITSSDDNADSNLHPKLTISYTCSCGIVCIAPQGSSKLLMVIGDDMAPSSNDVYKRDLFESWGYEVNYIDDNEDQATFNSELNLHDAAYVSETTLSTNIGNKLTNTSKGIVSEEGELNDELGISSSATVSNGTSIEFINVSHPISSVFAMSVQKIFSTNMNGLTASGTIAPGATTIGNLNGSPGMLAMETGSTKHDGGSFNGRRVMIPIGRDNDFVWPYLNNNGRLLIQRSIDWVSGDECNSQEYSIRVAMSSDDAEEYINGMVSLNNHDLDMIYDDEFPPGEQTIGLRFNDIPFDKNTEITAAYLDFTATSTANAATALTIHGEDVDNTPTFLTTSNNITSRTHTDNSVNWNPVANWDSTGSIYTSPDISIVIQEIIDRNNWQNGNALSLILSGAGSRSAFAYDASPGQAPLLRIQYCGDPIPVKTPIAHWKFDETSGTNAEDSINKFDGKLENGPVWNASGKIDGALSFDGSDDVVIVKHKNALTPTSEMTISAWVNNQDATLSGRYPIINKQQPFFSSGYSIAFMNNQLEVMIGAASFIPTNLFTSNQWYHLAITFNDAADEIRIYINGSLSLVQTTNAVLQNIPNDLLIGNDWLGLNAWNGLLDDIRIYDQVISEFEIANIYNDGGSSTPANKSAMSPASGCDGSFLDQFNNRDFNGDDGSLNWLSAWTEVGESDGADRGDIQVRNDTENYQLRTRDNNNGGEGVVRGADLSGASSASLHYEYRRQGLDNANDYTAVEVSSNGQSGPWTELTRISGSNNDSNYQSASHDISDHISPDTYIRFMTSASMGNLDTVWLDNIRIDCSP